MRRATTSLPVPLSPVSSTVVSARATLPMRACTLRMVSLTPTRSPMSRISSGPGSPATANRPRRVASRSSWRKGLVMRSAAPRFKAWTVVSVVAKAVITTQGRWKSSPFIQRNRSKPLPSLRRRSVTPASKAWALMAAWASSRLGTETTLKPPASRARWSTSRRPCSSSTSSNEGSGWRGFMGLQGRWAGPVRVAQSIPGYAESFPSDGP